MKAITVEPRKPGTASLEDIPEPDVRDGSVLVKAVAVGVCGTDVEIVEGEYGWPPPGKARLVLGHESLGRVTEPDPLGRFKNGDLVVGIVRRPDPVPCPNCAVGEWDMCRNGQYTERALSRLMATCRSGGGMSPITQSKLTAPSVCLACYLNQRFRQD